MTIELDYRTVNKTGSLQPERLASSPSADFDRSKRCLHGSNIPRPDDTTGILKTGCFDS